MMAAPHWLVLTEMAALIAGMLASVCAIGELLVRRRDCAFRGKVISRSAIRLLGMKRTRALRRGLWVSMLVCDFDSTLLHSVPVTAGWTLIGLWCVDDFVTGRDDWPRWRGKVGNRLRNLKPVRLRPVERWKPVPV